MGYVRLQHRGQWDEAVRRAYLSAGLECVRTVDLGNGWYESTLRRSHARPFHGQYPLKKRLADRDGGMRCAYCRVETTASQLTIDHFVPRSRGGTDEFENLLLACLACNQEKGAQLYRHPYRDGGPTR